MQCVMARRKPTNPPATPFAAQSGVDAEAGVGAGLGAGKGAGPGGGNGWGEGDRGREARPRAALLELAQAPARALEGVLTIRVDGVPDLLRLAPGLDLVLIRCDGVSDADELRGALEACASEGQGLSTIVWADRATVELARTCLRAGVMDIVLGDATQRELCAAIEGAAIATRAVRKRLEGDRRRARKLRELSRGVARTRRELQRQLGAVCGDLSGGYRTLAGNFKMVQLASELETLLRQELDAESLLRTTLEFLLRKVGTVNASIFLPGDCGDFRLGAYVNYDCPRDAAQEMLEELAGVLAPSFGPMPGTHVLADAGAAEPIARSEVLWLRDATACIHSAYDAGECKAIVCVFRDKRQPFGDSTARLIGIIGELFCQQLVRIARTSNRHLADKPWRERCDDERGQAA
jgi:DNA-binding NarL/FixJ family response regulator